MKTNFWNGFLLACILIFVGIIILIVKSSRTRKRASTLIPTLLTREWIRGRDLRQKLLKSGINISYGSFYLLMRDLEEQCACIASTVPENVEGENLPTRRFRLPLGEDEIE